MSQQPWWDFRRSAIASGHLLETGRAHGLTDLQCLKGTGLTIPLAGTRALVDAAQELGVARNLLRHLGDAPGLGRDAGLRYDLASLDSLGYALLSSATVREALHVGTRLFARSHAFSRLEVTEHADETVLRFHDEEIPDEVRRFFVERDAAATTRLLPFIPWPPDREDPTTIILAGSVLDIPMPEADPVTAEICRRQCSDLLQHRQRRTGLASDVREALLRDPGAMPSMDDVAGELHLTGRTLERRLAAAGTSYRALREEVLRTIGRELLRAGLSVEAVGRRLGYSEVAAFSRAFKSWTGQPPSVAATSSA